MKAVKKNRWLARLNAWLHLWLGLTSGIIVFIVALTGTLFIFCDDIIDGMAGSARYTQVQEKRLSPEALIAAFKKQVPGQRPVHFTFYKEASRTVKLGAADKDRVLRFSWIDPYTGKVLFTSAAYQFFYVVAHVHSGEMPFGDTGNLIVEIATWIFLIELITGLVLWWPRRWTRATRKQSFTIKWKAGFKRVNYDLHNVPGFYSLLPALLITVTGLIIVNKGLKKATHAALGGKVTAYEAARDAAPVFEPGKAFAPLNQAVDYLMASGPQVQMVRLQAPPGDSATALYAGAAANIGLKGVQSGKPYFMDRYTARPIALPSDVEKGLAIEGTVMNLHIGFWWGLTGKIITAIIGLVCMSLPITGFIIWWGRNNKKKKTAKKPMVAEIAEV